jgi:hypothetical protein
LTSNLSPGLSGVLIHDQAPKIGHVFNAVFCGNMNLVADWANYPR